MGLSGGKDSAALAIYIKDRYPELHDKIEYFFTDTGAELKEVYDFLDKLEAYLGKEIARLSSDMTLITVGVYNGFLPSKALVHERNEDQAFLSGSSAMT